MVTTPVKKLTNKPIGDDDETGSVNSDNSDSSDPVNSRKLGIDPTKVQETMQLTQKALGPRKSQIIPVGASDMATDVTEASIDALNEVMNEDNTKTDSGEDSPRRERSVIEAYPSKISIVPNLSVEVRSKQKEKGKRLTLVSTFFLTLESDSLIQTILGCL